MGFAVLNLLGHVALLIAVRKCRIIAYGPCVRCVLRDWTS